MGVKLQLLLGLLLFGSVCGSEENNRNFQNTSSEKIDSTNNVIEKLPKTDTQINVVNKDTQDNSDDSLKYSKYPIDNDTHKNQTRSQEGTDESSNRDENDGKGRQDNSRSIDIDKFASPDFHNNDYSSSDNQKFLENTIRKSSTKGYIDYSKFQLITPKTEYFDSKFEDAKQKLEQEYEDSAPEHLHDHHMDETGEIDEDEHTHLDHDLHIGRLFGNSKHNPNSSLDYKEKTKISRNNTFGDNSEHNEFRVVKVQKLNFASEYNVTTSDEDDTRKSETIPSREKPETTSPRGFILTTRKTVTLTKPPTSHNNHILSNKIESETIKAINLLTTEYSTTKRLKGENEIIPKEQSVEENKIIPLEITNQETITTEHSTTENIVKVINITTTTEQTKDTTANFGEYVEITTSKENPTPAVQIEQTTINNHVTDNEETTINNQEKDKNDIPVNMDDETTVNSDGTTVNNDETITSTVVYPEDRLKSTVTVNKVETTTSEFTTEQANITPFDTTSTTLSRDETTTETTNFPTTEDTTFVTTTKEAKEQTTSEKEETTEVTTTENGARISKAFSFKDAFTATSDYSETTTEPTRIRLFSTTETEASKTTDYLTVIKNGTDLDTTSTTEIKTETETSTQALASNKTTERETTVSPLTTLNETVTTINYVHVKVNLNGTTPLPETASPSSNYTAFTDRPKFSNISGVYAETASPSSNYTSFTNGPKFRNASGGSEETTTLGTTSSTEENTSDSSSGPDMGNVGGVEDNKGKIAAIVISTVGAVSLILLAGLLYLMRKRQKRFNYKQRCRPVSLDHYSVDNAGYSSTRRKAERQSKRSYGNPAFDDPVAITHPLNLPALAKFATNAADVKAEFDEIPQITAKISELPEGCETKNRYANVIPLPETRVFLQHIDGYPNSDYINANYVTGPKNTKGYYIACQGPMQNTVDDFWRMVWEQQSKVVLMITHLFENGVEKCVDYLPPSEVLDCNRLFGDFQVTLKKRDVKDKYIISNLQLKNMVSNSWREVTHFWYLGWPEKGVPTEENSLIAFLIEARSYMKTSTLDKTAAANGNTNGSPKNEVNPVVVHCSPGTGRTGVAIACDIAIREFEQTRLVDIPKIVYRIRRDRASAVQTKEQYMLIYKVISLYATKLTGGALDSF